MNATFKTVPSDKAEMIIEFVNYLNTLEANGINKYRNLIHGITATGSIVSISTSTYQFDFTFDGILKNVYCRNYRLANRLSLIAFLNTSIRDAAFRKKIKDVQLSL